MIVQKTSNGWQQIENAGGGVTFFMSWTRLEKVLRGEEPVELAANESIDKIETRLEGIQIYVVPK